MIKNRSWHAINQINRTFKSITPIFKGSFTLPKKGKPSFNNMSMMAFNHVVLFMSVWAYHTMMNTNRFKIRIEFSIFTTPICLNRLNFLRKLMLNEHLKLMKNI
jgi:hypothetical protein